MPKSIKLSPAQRETVWLLQHRVGLLVVRNDSAMIAGAEIYVHPETVRSLKRRAILELKYTCRSSGDYYRLYALNESALTSEDE